MKKSATSHDSIKPIEVNVLLLKLFHDDIHTEWKLVRNPFKLGYFLCAMFNIFLKDLLLVDKEGYFCRSGAWIDC